MIDTTALAPATVLLMALYDYRCALWQAQRHGTRPPAPPALSADARVDAYGAAMLIWRRASWRRSSICK